MLDRFEGAAPIWMAPPPEGYAGKRVRMPLPGASGESVAMIRGQKNFAKNIRQSIQQGSDMRRSLPDAHLIRRFHPLFLC